MAAYLIADFEILDRAGMRVYAERVGATIEQYGGTYLVRSGTGEIIEAGEWHPHRLVILKFESIEQAKRWYQSPEYATIKAIRHRAARTQIMLVQGI